MATAESKRVTVGEKVRAEAEAKALRSCEEIVRNTEIEAE